VFSGLRGKRHGVRHLHGLGVDAGYIFPSLISITANNTKLCALKCITYQDNCNSRRKFYYSSF
jgi:hypothetical protein